jgi:hypothetical protein
VAKIGGGSVAVSGIGPFFVARPVACMAHGSMIAAGEATVAAPAHARGTATSFSIKRIPRTKKW